MLAVGSSVLQPHYGASVTVIEDGELDLVDLGFNPTTVRL